MGEGTGAAPTREQWSTRFGFLLAAVGSAVGLGNMWRFSYLASEHGGAAFLLLYVALTLLVGLPVLLAELTVGRGAGKGPIQALVHFGGRRWSVLGWFFVVGAALVLSYYSVIAGWTLRYALEALLVGFASDAGARFGEISTGGPAIAWHVAFMAVTVGVVMGASAVASSARACCCFRSYSCWCWGSHSTRQPWKAPRPATHAT